MIFHTFLKKETEIKASDGLDLDGIEDNWSVHEV